MKETTCDAMGHYGADPTDSICPKCNRPYSLKEDKQEQGEVAGVWKTGAPLSEGYYHTLGSVFTSYWHSDKLGWWNDAGVTHWLDRSRAEDNPSAVKSKEEILKKHIRVLSSGQVHFSGEEIMNAMEEYASQFKADKPEAVELLNWINDHGYYRDPVIDEWYDSAGEGLGNTSELYQLFKAQPINQDKK